MKLPKIKLDPTTLLKLAALVAQAKLLIAEAKATAKEVTEPKKPSNPL